MMPVKMGKPAIDVIKLCYRADRPVLLVGHHGIGKSEIIATAASELGIGFICRDLSIMEPPDLLGMPQITVGRTTYAPPGFLPANGNGLLVFEELNRCQEFMRAPCLQLLTSRCLNDYRLPAGWLPVAAVNPVDEGYEVQELDPALRARFVEVRVVPDVHEWVLWARAGDIHESVIRFVAGNNAIFDDAQSNPRAWKYVSDLVHCAESQQASQATLRVAITGLVGEKCAASFMKSLKTATTSMTVDDVLDRFAKIRSRIRSFVQNNQLDPVRKLLHDMQVHLQPKSAFLTVRQSPKQAANLASFISELPDDLQQQAEQFLAERKYEFPQRRKKKAS
ncbi:MAG: AAA family ATPase [Planctomycetia bacterium]|nr:AAA family ATPase [Planctomycetia bacterium]